MQHRREQLRMQRRVSEPPRKLASATRVRAVRVDLSFADLFLAGDVVLKLREENAFGVDFECEDDEDGWDG